MRRKLARPLAFPFPTAMQFSAPLLLCVKINLEKGHFQGKPRAEIPREVPQHTREASKPVIALSKLMLEGAEHTRELAELMQTLSETERMLAEPRVLESETLLMAIETDARAPETDARGLKTAFYAP